MEQRTWNYRYARLRKQMPIWCLAALTVGGCTRVPTAMQLGNATQVDAGRQDDDHSERAGSGAGNDRSDADGRASSSDSSSAGKAASGKAKGSSDASGGSSGSAGKPSDQAQGSSNDGQGGAEGGDSGPDAGVDSEPPAIPNVRACTARQGEVVCDGAILYHCAGMGGADSMEQCETAAQCRAGIPAGKCAQCDPGDYRCTDATLEWCNDSGEWEMKDECPTAELCHNGLPKHSCDPMKCEADSYDCSDGTLNKCRDDLTDFDYVQACPSELCDANAGKCYECQPSTTDCEGTTAVTCSEDGMKSTQTCSGSTPYCAGGKCVQCTSDSDCDALATDCRKAACDTGRGVCVPGDAMPAHIQCSLGGGTGHCDYLGNCLACVDDTDCDSSERCDPVVGCTARSPLQLELGQLPGLYTVTVAPGYKLDIEAQGEIPAAEPINVTYGLTNYCTLRAGGSTKCDQLTASSQARTLTISGPAGAGCTNLLGGLTARTTLELRFNPSNPPQGETPNCDQPILVLTAKQ